MSSNLVLTDVPWSVRGDGLLLTVRLTPKSARDEIGGVERLSDGRTVLKVTRARGSARRRRPMTALIRLLAKALHISASAVRLESGASGRLKILHLQGDAGTLARPWPACRRRRGFLKPPNRQNFRGIFIEGCRFRGYARFACPIVPNRFT